MDGLEAREHKRSDVKKYRMVVTTFNYKYPELVKYVDSKEIQVLTKSDDLSKINNWLNENKSFALKKVSYMIQKGWFR